MRSANAWIHFLIALGYWFVLTNVTAAESDRPHLLILVADDLRADLLGTYGGPVATPNLDRLAARGALFRRAVCGYPICHVSRTEMLCGRSVIREAASGQLIPFPQDWVLWPQAFARAGYHTIHLGKWHVRGTPAQRGYLENAALFGGGGAGDKPLTLSRSATGRDVSGYVGWLFKDPQGVPLPEFGIGLTPKTDDRITDEAIRVIGERGPSGRPLFVHVNFTAPHDPLHWPTDEIPRPDHATVPLPKNFAPHHPFDHGNLGGRDETIVPGPRSQDDVRRERAVYQAIVAKLDAQVGRILEAIDDDKGGQWLVIFTSDQGLALGSHGLMGKQNQYEHTVNSPLILAGPGIPHGQSFTAQCALRDLYPTTCELAGIPIPPSVESKSLVPLLQGKVTSLHPQIGGYYETSQRMIRTEEGWKLIRYPKANRQQLFYLPDDPDELHDLSDDPARRAKLDELIRKLPDDA